MLTMQLCGLRTQIADLWKIIFTLAVLALGFFICFYFLGSHAIAAASGMTAGIAVNFFYTLICEIRIKKTFLSKVTLQQLLIELDFEKYRDGVFYSNILPKFQFHSQKVFIDECDDYLRIITNRLNSKRIKKKIEANLERPSVG